MVYDIQEARAIFEKLETSLKLEKDELKKLMVRVNEHRMKIRFYNQEIKRRKRAYNVLTRDDVDDRNAVRNIAKMRKKRTEGKKYFTEEIGGDEIFEGKKYENQDYKN